MQREEERKTKRERRKGEGQKERETKKERDNEGEIKKLYDNRSYNKKQVGSLKPRSQGTRAQINSSLLPTPSSVSNV